VTLLSAPQGRAALGTMPYTLVPLNHDVTPSATRTLTLGFWRASFPTGLGLVKRIVFQAQDLAVACQETAVLMSPEDNHVFILATRRTGRNL
jgi:hypothetical protein